MCLSLDDEYLVSQEIQPMEAQPLHATRQEG